MTGQTEVPTLDSVLTQRIVERTESLVQSDMSDLLGDIEERITAAESLRDEIDESAREVRTHLARLEASKRALLKERKTPVRPASTSAERHATQKAGAGNVEKIVKLLKRRPHTKAEITSKLSLNNGTVTWGLRALEEQGRARKTGVRARGSEQYEFVR